MADKMRNRMRSARWYSSRDSTLTKARSSTRRSAFFVCAKRARTFSCFTNPPFAVAICLYPHEQKKARRRVHWPDQISRACSNTTHTLTTHDDENLLFRDAWRVRRLRLGHGSEDALQRSQQQLRGVGGEWRVLRRECADNHADVSVVVRPLSSRMLR